MNAVNEQQSIGEQVKPAMPLIDALAILASTPGKGKRGANPDLVRLAQAVVDRHVEGLESL